VQKEETKQKWTIGKNRSSVIRLRKLLIFIFKEKIIDFDNILHLNLKRKMLEFIIYKKNMEVIIFYAVSKRKRSVNQ
jgi:hypothetical protein